MEKHKKKHKNTGSHGAVSVFLAIILVPCIVFTCIFCDLSRVQLSMATSLSAADLSLYSLMARYDPDLKEFYGLIGSCQDVDSFYNVTATYFEGMLKAEGVSGEGSQLFLNYIRDLKNQEPSDFLQTDIVTPIKVESTKNGAMGENPALIEDGIVEFMKYRGPIQITANIIERFSELNLDKTSAEAKDNEDVVEKKQEYAKKQGELLEAAFVTYLKIREYDDMQHADGIPSVESYANLETKTENIRDDLKAVTALVAKYYYPGTEWIYVVDFPSFEVPEVEHYGEKVTQEGGTEIYCIDNEDLNKLLENLDSDMQDIEDAGTAFLEACSNIRAPEADVNNVVYCMQTQQAADDNNVSNAMRKGREISKRYAELQAAAECEPFPDERNDLPENWKEQLSDAQENVKDIFDTYLDENSSSVYRSEVKRYSGIAKETVPKVQNRSFTFESKLLGATATVDQFAVAVDGYLPSIYAKLNEQLTNVLVAIVGGTMGDGEHEKTVLPITELVDKATEFTNARNNWGDTSASYDTEYAKKEHKLYESVQSQSDTASKDTDLTPTDDEAAGERIAAKITAENVTELKTRLENIRDDITDCMNALSNFTYGGTSVLSMGNSDQIIILARSAVNSAPASASIRETNQAAIAYADQLISPHDGKVFTAKAINNDQAGNNPNLDSDTPTLYKFLKNQLQDKDGIENEIDNNKKRTKGYEDKADDAEKKAKGVDASLVANKGKDLTGGHAENPVDLLSGLGSIVTVADNVITGKGDELRDQLYVCEYIMDMFSYSDFDSEGKYRLLLKGVDSEDGEVNKGVQKKTDVTYRDWPYDGAKTAWETEATDEVLRNQSLTNRPINTSNNFSNLGEVEYILYGKNSIDENLKASYGNILAIRETMNLVSGFCNFYTGTNGTAGVVGSIATAVAGATAGIVPIPVTKCVLIGVLATLETSKDMERLKKGARVELYKSDEKQWVYCLEGTMDATFNEGAAKEGATESGMYYSDYLYAFLMVGLTNDKTYKSMLLRVGDLIEANMKLTEGNGGFDLDKTICYFSLKGQLRVKPLMMALPIASTIEGADGLKEKTDWCTYNVNVIRGYS